MILIYSAILVFAATQVIGEQFRSERALAAQFQPTFPSLEEPKGVTKAYNPGPYTISRFLSHEPLRGFPVTWNQPDPLNVEVQAIYNKIDWSKVPSAPVRQQYPNGTWVSISDGPTDPYCWWSSTNCVSPKSEYIPNDIYTCQHDGDWGLTYDDGPLNVRPDAKAVTENAYAEPALYNFLAKHNAHATLFFVGSNVASYPAAAKLALNDGHQLCVHSWSHVPLTTLSNAQIVAELYWTLKAIKAATGVTSKCFRPPQGDIDDRVRAIAWQMGMRTILWDRDTKDWAMSAPGSGALSTKAVDGFFEQWITDYKSGRDTAGHIVLEHELTSRTVEMSMYWLPKIKKVFNVVPALSCAGVSQPYWEEDFVYPTVASKKVHSSAISKELKASKASKVQMHRPNSKGRKKVERKRSTMSPV
ncbi:hypothetical protein BDF20DRAFT_980158 [Mycotypha africana]|uniref:uncharacterized protein n=1 Tax=Mycotypha africana TaxID=64632 RepID=UPI00230195CB|nr:uncharacterized protein BDF20DRAFT_980158 [Mycotypha africana]KAI8970370.1 hypothetical protein BDF20DRAFT_980158 [Mycotypha africana]